MIATEATIPQQLQKRLPLPSPDGNIYADVKFRGSWDGIIVVNSAKQIIGVYVGRHVSQSALPFSIEQIEDFRTPCLWNRLLAAFPNWCDPWAFSLLSIWLLCPASLLLGDIYYSYMLFVPTLFVGFAIPVMYSVRGFPFIRLPTAIAGLSFVVAGITLFMRSLT